MQKNLIFVFQSKEKLYLCNVFSEHESFYCSISQPNWYLERDFYEQNQYYIEAVPYGADFNHSSIGAVPSPAESMDGACAFFMPIPIVLPLPDFDERIIK